MNKCYLKSNEVWFTPFDGDAFKIGLLSDANIENGYMILNGQCYPLDMQFDEEREIIEEWDELYPNGKPIEVVEVKHVVTEDEKVRDMVNQLFEAYLASFTTK